MSNRSGEEFIRNSLKELASRTKKHKPNVAGLTEHLGDKALKFGDRFSISSEIDRLSKLIKQIELVWLDMDFKVNYHDIQFLLKLDNTQFGLGSRWNMLEQIRKRVREVGKGSEITRADLARIENLKAQFQASPAKQKIINELLGSPYLLVP